MNNMGDKEYLEDCISSQKYIASSYNSYAFECVDSQLKNDMLTILKDEQMINKQLFDQMQSNGWYQVQYAQPQQVTELAGKFSSFKNTNQ